MRELRRMLTALVVLAVVAVPAGVALAASPAPPTVTTGNASGVTSTTATVNGTVNPNGVTTQYQFQYSTTPVSTTYAIYGLATPPAGVGSGTGDVAVHQTLTNLAPNTTYHYRLFATNDRGTTYGAEQTFTTKSAVASSKVQVLAPTAFVSPHGVLGVGIGCFGGSASCNGTLALTRGSTVYASRGFNLSAESGGFAHFSLSSSAQHALFRHYTRPVAIRITINTNSGQHISQVIYLVRWF